MGILSFILWTPALGAATLTLLPPQNSRLLSFVSRLFAIIGLGEIISLWRLFNPQAGELQFTEFFQLNEEIGNAYALGVDGISMPLLLWTSLIFCASLFVTHNLKNKHKSFFIFALLLEFACFGVFLAQDWTFFFAFWESALIPVFFLIDRWGGHRRHAASLNFILDGVGSSIFLLISLFALAKYVPPFGGTSMAVFEQTALTLAPDKQLWILCGFLLSFGVLLPLFPFHGWLPLVCTIAPTPVNMLISGLLLNLGAYGLFRITPMLAAPLQILHTPLLWLTLFSMLYGGLLAWRQVDLKAMLAYSAMSMMNVFLLSFLTLNFSGILGATLHLSALTLISSSLFLLFGLLAERTGTSNIQLINSVAQSMPRFAALTSLSIAALMALPGTISFVAILHTIIGGYQAWNGWIILLSFSLLISSAYAIRTLSLLFTGPAKSSAGELKDLSIIETLTASILTGAIIILGFYPAPVQNLSDASVRHLATLINSRNK